MINKEIEVAVQLQSGSEVKVVINSIYFSTITNTTYPAFKHYQIDLPVEADAENLSSTLNYYALAHYSYRVVGLPDDTPISGCCRLGKFQEVSINNEGQRVTSQAFDLKIKSLDDVIEAIKSDIASQYNSRSIQEAEKDKDKFIKSFLDSLEVVESSKTGLEVVCEG